METNIDIAPQIMVDSLGNIFLRVEGKGAFITIPRNYVKDLAQLLSGHEVTGDVIGKHWAPLLTRTELGDED